MLRSNCLKKKKKTPASQWHSVYKKKSFSKHPPGVSACPFTFSQSYIFIVFLIPQFAREPSHGGALAALPPADSGADGRRLAT